MGWLADRQQWTALEDLFCDEVVIDYTSLHGGEPVRWARADVVAAWRPTFEGMQATQHLIAGHLVTFGAEAGTARCTANFQATHLGWVDGRDATWTLGGHYRFDLVRQAAGWRLAGVTMTAVWETGSRQVLTGGGPR